MGEALQRRAQKEGIVAGWPGAMASEGCPLGELLGCLPPSPNPQRIISHTHQPTKGHLLVALPGMAASHCSPEQPLASGALLQTFTLT